VNSTVRPLKIKAMKYKRWVGLGQYKLNNLVKIARENGLNVIVGFKPCLFFYYELGLEGTKSQMEDVEKTWKASGQEVRNRKPKAACGFNWPASKKV